MAHAEEVFVRTHYFEVILAFFLDVAAGFFQIDCHQIGRKLVLADLEVLLVNELEVENEKEVVVVDRSAFEAFRFFLFCLFVAIADRGNATEEQDWRSPLLNPTSYNRENTLQ